MTGGNRVISARGTDGATGAATTCGPKAPGDGCGCCCLSRDNKLPLPLLLPLIAANPAKPPSDVLREWPGVVPVCCCWYWWYCWYGDSNC